MKSKVASVLMSAALVISLAVLPGCSKTISGSVSEVIEQAQGVQEKEDVTIEVTGRTSTLLPGSMSKSGEYYTIYIEDGDEQVQCFFDDEQDIGMGERITVSGRLSTSLIEKDHISIFDCKLK